MSEENSTAQCQLTIASHAHCQTLLKPTILTAISMMLSNFTTFAASALVAQLLTNTAFEEPLTALAADGTVVPAAGSISTDYT